ncbi:DUF6262 family protein [Streptosporangium sp. NBC_01639]|uniref:DUF6262 family protein n=1 Tax=Streptosporangium sp. NBC_01639 TaxID=2975948 RepID=UPI00386E2F07|nr:DUF6262 family protein [Streptosporangium sp. NBC_01639]
MLKDADVTSSDKIRDRTSDGAPAKRTPAQVLREARARDSEIKRGRVLKALKEMFEAEEKITFLKLARTARVSHWLVYAEGLREHIKEAIEKQGRPVREAELGSGTSAEARPGPVQ